jgi:hypothetical protein
MVESPSVPIFVAVKKSQVFLEEILFFAFFDLLCLLVMIKPRFFPSKRTCSIKFLLVLSREWMGMGEWGNGMIITSDCGSFPKIPCV